MTKAEIIEAINNTIVPNGEKAITAESLANLLIEMANATPEGGSGGGSGSGVFNIAMGDPETGELSEAEKANNIAIYNQYAVDDSPSKPVFFMGYLASFNTIDEAGNLLFEVILPSGYDATTFTLLGMTIPIALMSDGTYMMM